jgi:hypothetical protein
VIKFLRVLLLICRTAQRLFQDSTLNSKKASLTEFYPNELSALGIREYRQRFFKPYQIIYRVMGKRVYIYLIADGRRDFQTLLARRLLSS